MMHAPLAQVIEIKPGAGFVTEFDETPGFWNFLLALDRDDLIAELVQNDLDQEATRTVITFEQNQLVCEGDGKPVEADGWQRLRKLRGAGDTVPAKRGKIGVKNHGLKTAFTIGDEIRVLSAGQAITQTLYARGRENAPYPGASPEPEPDPQAPLKGCRVVIRYRDRAIEPPLGEAIVLGAVSTQEIDALFTSACASTPEQFAGIVSPEVAPQYEIVLRHWRLGEACFALSCTRPRKIARGIEIFRRRCHVSGTAPSLPAGLQEKAARRLLPLTGRLKQRAADFFRRGNRFLVEVSWSVDARGRPKTGTGRFRYPIGYPAGSHEARTGHGAFFNAPIVSDTERHGPARNDATNKELREACETLLVDALARSVIPRWGADGLNPLVPSPESDDRDEAVRPLLAALARQDAIPKLNWADAAGLLLKGRRRNAKANRAFLRRRPGAPRKYRFVAPVMTWKRDVIHASLSLICPRAERQLDPRIHPAIVRLLTDMQTDGFYKDFITFDEDDALSRAKGEGNQFFAACDNPEGELAQPLLARSYLDVINEAIEHEKCSAQTEDALQEALLLPDTRCKAEPFRVLHASAPLPSEVPGLRIPPILHADIASHPILRRRKWRRPNYTMARFLESEGLREADEETRKLFWKWLRQNERRVGPRDRPKLAELPIWPDVHGNIHRLGELCDPRSRRIATILGEAIRRPHDDVRRSKIAASRTGRSTMRRVPSQDEIEGWLDSRMAAAPPGETPGPDAIAALNRLETDLAVLLKDAALARVLKATRVTLPALARDGSIRPRTKLLMPVTNHDRLALRGRFLLKDRHRAAALNKLSSALSAPTVDMLLSTFQEDGGNFAALQPRLHQFLSLTEPADANRVQLGGMPIIPVHGQARAPRDLAFQGQKGDYWGTWKTRISSKGLSQDDQRRCRDAGVTSATPDSDTSRVFLQWLSSQGAAVLERHIACVLRHILHRSGPESWAKIFTDTPFIPARDRSGLRLVSLRMAHHRPVFLPDARDIAEAVLARDPGVLLVIDRVREVAEPISEPLRRLGVRSLREAIGEPEHAAGSGKISQATDGFLDRFDALRSTKFRRALHKRLDELGVEPELVRRDWHDRLSRVTAIRLAERVEARYRFRGKPYTVAADAAFDPASGTFWIEEGDLATLSSLYEAVAAQLVFKPIARPVHLLALERALALEIHDPSFGQPLFATAGAQEDDGLEDEAAVEGEDGIDDDDDEPGEAVFGHSPFHPDASRNVPDPQPFSASLGVKPQPRHYGDGGTGAHKGGGDGSSAPELEKDHIEKLKRGYASHCQMCLCKRPPQVLAPAQSYIQWEEVRRRVVEAHHVDLKSVGGARHAGNLILLCKLHHDNYGRRLTRAAVSATLRGEKKDKVVCFGPGSDGVSEVKGQVIEIAIPDTGEIVAMFFTDYHAGFWLSQAQSAAGTPDFA
jgi:hypothetical protein